MASVRSRKPGLTLVPGVLAAPIFRPLLRYRYSKIDPETSIDQVKIATEIGALAYYLAHFVQNPA